MSFQPRFKMYIKPTCPFCIEARRIIVEELQMGVMSEDVTDDKLLRERLKQETGVNTVPLIYFGDQFIGGCTDLRAAIDSGEMEKYILREENTYLKNEISFLRRSIG
jgi:glutaredoxin 3